MDQELIYSIFYTVLVLFCNTKNLQHQTSTFFNTSAYFWFNRIISTATLLVHCVHLESLCSSSLRLPVKGCCSPAPPCFMSSLINDVMGRTMTVGSQGWSWLKYTIFLNYNMSNYKQILIVCTVTQLYCGSPLWWWCLLREKQIFVKLIYRQTSTPLNEVCLFSWKLYCGLISWRDKILNLFLWHC